MENFDNNNLKQNRRAAPEGMYSHVRERIVSERIKIAKTRRQLAIGSALLLIVGIVNIGIILFYPTENQPVVENNIEKTLYETYFDNQMPLQNAK
jgi:hypothetical protein